MVPLNSIAEHLVVVNPDSDLTPVARLYADVFAGPPWGEYTKCPECNTFYGLRTKVGDLCSNKCRTPLTLAYPLDETVKYIAEELSKPKSKGLLIGEGSEVKAFAWGYAFNSAEQFIQEKYHTEETAKRVRQSLCAMDILEELFYVSEVGVHSVYRGNGWSNILTGQLVAVADDNGIPVVMRTNHVSPMVRVGRKNGMEIIMGHGTDLPDSENPERVLLARSARIRVLQ
jgi:predicted GNAT family acetyltransferase